MVKDIEGMLYEEWLRAPGVFNLDKRRLRGQNIAAYSFFVRSGGLGKMNIPVLSDLTKQISRDYGVLLEGPGIALRGLFIIDPNGIIKHLSVNDLPVGRSVEETLRLVKAFQFVETHGEVCPANWTPNSPTSFFQRFLLWADALDPLLLLKSSTKQAFLLSVSSVHPDTDKIIPVLFRPPGLMSAFTVAMVRSPEFDNGIEVMDRNGKVIGVSKKAGEKIKRADLEPEILTSTEETEFFYNRGI
ncbi:hypothetical protein TURU_132767 [Turdus rufiventris]|nr:hypothetical protein TURU_132767 [Turdus rufiventris]